MKVVYKTDNFRIVMKESRHYSESETFSVELNMLNSVWIPVFSDRVFEEFKYAKQYIDNSEGPY